MTLEEVKKLVIDDYHKKFRVTDKNGKKYYVRLWNYHGCVAIMTKGNKKYGRYLEPYQCENWLSLAPYKKREVDTYKRMMKRASAALEMLNRSGFWADIKKEVEYFLTHEEDARQVAKDLEDCKLHRKYFDGQYSWMHSPQIFETFACTRCWKSIVWNTWYAEREKHNLHTAIEEKRNYSAKWKNGYDCSVEVSFDNGMARGWYSEEYVGCGNGHYYLLFDEKHAIFYEND